MTLDPFWEDVNAGLVPRRALSLKQPWAWAVLHAGKNIENRTWWTDFRGDFWIASSAQVSHAYYDDAAARIYALTGLHPPHHHKVEHGVILGRAKVVACIWPGGTSIGPGSPPHPLHPQRWHFLDQYGYVLEDVRAVAKPVPCKGRQQWWTVPLDVLDQLRSAC
jgi:hypothetical protein